MDLFSRLVKLVLVFFFGHSFLCIGSNMYVDLHVEGCFTRYLTKEALVSEYRSHCLKDKLKAGNSNVNNM